MLGYHWARRKVHQIATATEEQTSVIESLNVDITEINTLNQEGVENLNATLRACGDLEQQASRAGGEAGAGLLGEAITAYRAALRVRAITQLLEPAPGCFGIGSAAATRFQVAAGIASASGSSTASTDASSASDRCRRSAPASAAAGSSKARAPSACSAHAAWCA